MKHIKLIVGLAAVACLIPSYYRNRDAVDRKVVMAWNEALAYWHSESPETRRLKAALTSNPMHMGGGGKSAGELHDEVIRKSEERIDKQEAKDITGEPQKN